MSKNTVRTQSAILRNLSRFLNKKPMLEINETDVKKFLAQYPRRLTRDLYATCLILFYRYHFKLKKKQKPAFLDYYEYMTAKDRDREIDPKAKEQKFITAQEHKDIMQQSPNFQDKAIWETLYLSGTRCGELCSMNVGDVQRLTEGYQITVNKSKTRPRIIPLSQNPEHLIRWLKYHPQKDNPQSPLWISNSNRRQGGRLNTAALDYKFKIALQRAKITRPLTPHSYRRTRATIMFRDYTDTHMGKYFGWRISAVGNRREEYDLTSDKELQAKVHNGLIQPPSYDAILQEKETLQNELTQIKQQIADQEKRINDLLIREVRKESKKGYIDGMTPKRLGKGLKYEELLKKQKQLKN